MKYRNILLLLLLSLPLALAAQTNGSNSPYSRYGFGLMGDGANAFNKSMGGVGYGFRDGKQINTKNPASYAAVDSLTFLFDVGMTLQFGHLKQGTSSVNAKNTAIDYVSAAFRAKPGLGFALGMRPVSTIGYSMSNSTPREDVATIPYVETTSFSGNGGLHEVYVGAGWTPFRGLARRGTDISLGVNMGYLWGVLSHSVSNTFSDANIAGTRQSYDAEIRTYNAQFALQYAQRVGKSNFVLGATYGLGHKINSTAYYYNQKVESSNVTAADTLVCSKAFSLPHTVGVGLTYEWNQRLRVGFDYTVQYWSAVKFPAVSADRTSYSLTDDAFSDRTIFQLGAEYVPNPDGVKWHQHIRYRLGASFATPYAKVDGQDGPSSYTLNLGAGIPIINHHNNRSLLNVSVQYEHVQPKQSWQIKENYLRLCLGISFNESWFKKWRVE